MYKNIYCILMNYKSDLCFRRNSNLINLTSNIYHKHTYSLFIYESNTFSFKDPTLDFFSHGVKSQE